MTFFGLTILEALAVGTVIVGLVGAYWRLVIKGETSDTISKNSNMVVVEKIEALKLDLETRFNDLTRNSAAQMERDKEWRQDYERRVLALENESRETRAINASLLSGLSDVKAQNTYFVTRLDSFMATMLSKKDEK